MKPSDKLVVGRAVMRAADGLERSLPAHVLRDMHPEIAQAVIELTKEALTSVALELVGDPAFGIQVVRRG